MKKTTYIILITLLACPTAAQACKYAEYSAKDRVVNSNAVYIGIVSGIKIPSLETNKNTENRLYTATREYRIVVKKTIKGEIKNIIKISVHWCGNVKAELGQKVVVFKNNSNIWHITNNGNYITETNNAEKKP